MNGTADTFEHATRMYELINARIQSRISHLWKSRFAAWGLFLAFAAVFIKDINAIDSNVAKWLLAILIILAILGIAKTQIDFEDLQEDRIKNEREYAMVYLRLAQDILAPKIQQTLEPFDTDVKKFVRDLRLPWVTRMLAFLVSGGILVLLLFPAPAATASL